jgi:predicted nuclease of predicted toxin-antitoxin system
MNSMRFLIDANMPRRATDVIIASGHHAVDVRGIGLGGATDEVIAAYAQSGAHAIVTRDTDFGDIRNYPPASYHGIVVLALPDDATADQVLRLLESFLNQASLIAQLPGRLMIVEPGRVRIRG